MSNRTLIEINHDYTPHTPAEKATWVDAIERYLNSADPRCLPDGVTFFNFRHHSDECPMGSPPLGWQNDQPRKAAK